MRTEQLVGVVIPTRDGERHLAEAIESVLGQTHQALDVVVADDGSTDATRQIARSYAPEVRCIPLPHRGLGATRNAGIRSVRGDYVAFLDQDDVWPERKLELQLGLFDERPSPHLVFGAVREFISPELEPGLARRIRCLPEARPAALPGAMLTTRATLAEVGPFASRWRSNDFLAWLLTARRQGLREAMLAEPVLWRRLHQFNTSHQGEVTRAEYLHVLKESLDCRRTEARGR